MEITLDRTREQRWKYEKGSWREGWDEDFAPRLVLEAWVDDEDWAERLLRDLAEWSEVEALSARPDIDNPCWCIGAYR